jgi:hypothetical protein
VTQTSGRPAPMWCRSRAGLYTRPHRSK